MKAIWKGSITFALVSIRVKLYPATSRKEISLRLLHKADSTPIEYKRHCPLDNRDLPQEEIVKGFEYQKRKFVVLSGEEFKTLPQFAAKSINIEGFIDAGQIPSLYFDKGYYLEPEAGSERPYALLATAMRESGKTALARVALKEREHLAVLGIYGGALLLNTLLYQDEIAAPSRLNLPGPDVKPSKEELALARELISRFSRKFEPSEYKDTYHEALMGLINAKIEGKEIKTAPPRPAGPRVVSLMDALKKSLEKKGAAGPGKAEPKKHTSNRLQGTRNK